MQNCKIESGKYSVDFYDYECPKSDGPFAVSWNDPSSFDFQVVQIGNNNTVTFTCDVVVYNDIKNVPNCKNTNRKRRSTNQNDNVQLSTTIEVLPSSTGNHKPSILTIIFTN